MSNFDIYKWNRERHLIEARLNEKKSKNDRIFDLFFNELEDFDGVANYLKRYRNTIMRGLDSIDFDYLPKPSMMEEGEGTTLNLSQDDMDKLHKDGKLELDGHKILYKVKESLDEAEGMETYSVEGDIQDPDGGSDGSFGPVKVQVKAGLKDKDLRMAIKRAAEDEIVDRIYKFDYKKA